jgi:hypothetical protein
MKAIEAIYDFAGNRICVGDTVVCIAREKGYGKLTSAVVVELNPKMVTLEFPELEWEYFYDNPRKRVKVRSFVRHNAVFFMRGVA